MNVKKCSNCFKTKSTAEFYKKLAGYQARCKACNAEVVRGYMKRKKQKDMARRWAILRGET